MRCLRLDLNQRHLSTWDLIHIWTFLVDLFVCSLVDCVTVNLIKNKKANEMPNERKNFENWSVLYCIETFPSWILHQLFHLYKSSHSWLKLVFGGDVTIDHPNHRGRCGVVFGKHGRTYRARTIRNWARGFCVSGNLPELNQDKLQKTKSLIDEEDVKISLLGSYDRWSRDKRSASEIKKWINGHLSRECDIPYRILTVSKRTARNWFIKLNFSYQDYKQGSQLIDGHEHPDVVAHRESFVDEMALWQKQMETYEGNDMQICVSPSQQEQPRVVLVTQDECIFQAHDGRKKVWQEETRKVMRPKGGGASIMVSAFLCPCHGIITLTRELEEQSPHIGPDCTKIMHPGIHKDEYFTNDDLAVKTLAMMVDFTSFLHCLDVFWQLIKSPFNGKERICFESFEF